MEVRSKTHVFAVRVGAELTIPLHVYYALRENTRVQTETVIVRPVQLVNTQVVRAKQLMFAWTLLPGIIQMLLRELHNKLHALPIFGRTLQLRLNVRRAVLVT
jgi:hypothetical protein